MIWYEDAHAENMYGLDTCKIEIYLDIFLCRFEQSPAEVFISCSFKNPKLTWIDPGHCFWAVALFGSVQVMYHFVRSHMEIMI